jgi:NitT/TauT family transport system permease protein
VIAVMIVIMGIGMLVDGVVFKRIENKVMTRWGLR